MGKLGMGEQLMPDPELGQDVAFLAFVIEDMKAKLLRAMKACPWATHSSSHTEPMHCIAALASLNEMRAPVVHGCGCTTTTMCRQHQKGD